MTTSRLTNTHQAQTEEFADHPPTKETNSARTPFQEVASTLFSSIETEINTIVGQLDNTASTQKLRHRPYPFISFYAAAYLTESSKGIEVFLPPALRHSIQPKSVLPESSHQKIGLLRAPKVNEALIKNHEYNLSMAQEALILGSHYRQQVQSGHVPSFHSLWAACRKWRVSHLTTSSDQDEVSMFCTGRLNRMEPQSTTSMMGTMFQPHETQYGHLCKDWAQRLGRDDALAFLGEDCSLVKHELEQEKTGELIKRVSLQFSTTIENKTIPLTEIRMVLNIKNESVRDAWTHIENDCVPITLDELEPVLLHPHGIMLHTQAKYLNTLAQEIERLMKDYSSTLNGNALRKIDLKNPNDLLTLKKLGDIHYLLAQAMFDQRGSASKSELYIRTLAIGNGLELPAFKRGFVPDLEAFVNSRQTFIKNYPNTFEF